MTDVRRGTHARIIGAALAAVAIGVSAFAGSPAAGDAALTRFLNARTSLEAQRAVAAVVASGVPFDEAFARLKRGRVYSANVPRGVTRMSRRVGRETFYFDVDVPKTYDPNKQYQVRFQLHGGVGGQHTSEPRPDGLVGQLQGDEQIYVMPYAWVDAPWWSVTQIRNLRAILDTLKRTYNIDENRVALAGVSDGATATYYVAMLDPTPFSSFLSLNGFFMVLGNPSVRADDDLFTNNLLNRPFFLVNGGADPIYPARIVEPYYAQLQEGGLALQYWPQPNAAHNTAWWPEMKDKFEAFVREHPRSAIPERLTWESADASAFNRLHWLIIDKLAFRPDIAPLPDLKDFIQQVGGDDQPPSPKLLIHDAIFGRVDLVRSGNTIDAKANGVSEFTLLISPDAFNLSEPITITVNDRPVFNGRVTPSVTTLMKWSARDNDRTMLFAAELHIKVP